MSSLAKQVSAVGLGDRIFSERQLREALGGSDARRYSLVNRALKEGALVRIKRGTYALARSYHDDLVHPFAVAQALLPGSYVSFETALAHHGWIPEAVFVTANVTPARKTLQFDTADFGSFKYHPLAIADYRFLTRVERVHLGKLAAFIAQPLRAIMDLVALRKVEWSDLDWLTSGLRVDEEKLLALTRKDFAELKAVYKHSRVNVFLAAFEHAVVTEKTIQSRQLQYD